MWLSWYKRSAEPLANLLYWDCLEEVPWVIRQKDGSFLAVMEVRGPDLASALDEELVSFTGKLNTILRGLGNGWGVWVDTQKVPSTHYVSSQWPDRYTAKIDVRRRQQYQTPGTYYTIRTHISLAYAPPKRALRGWQKWLYTNIPVEMASAADYTYFCDEVQHVRGLFEACCPHVVLLEATPDATGASPLLSYLQSTVSPRPRPVGFPEDAVYLSDYLTTSDLYTGLYPSWGSPDDPGTFQGYLACLSLRRFPRATFPGILDAMLDVPFPFRWVSRYLPLSVPTANAVMYSYRKRWLGAHKRMGSHATEHLYGAPSMLVEEGPLQHMQEIADAQTAMQRGEVSYGYGTTTIVLTHRDFPTLQRQIEQCRKNLETSLCLAKVEDLNTVAAWLGTLPGDRYSNVRLPLLSSHNISHFLPLMTPWPGEGTTPHLNGPALFTATGPHQQPLPISLHQGDVGHVGVIGATGNGKSTLLNFLCLQWRRYPGAEVVIFDKGGAARMPTMAVNGAWYDLGNTALQPLADIDHPEDRRWALDWLDNLCELERCLLNPDQKASLYKALQGLSVLPVQDRTLTRLVALLDEVREIAIALQAYTNDGPYGSLLDGKEDALADNPWLCFEMETLLETPKALNAVLPALFHRLQRRLTGVPVRYFLHEGWLAFDTPYWAPRLRAWLKGFRVKNASVIIATQSLEDATDASIHAALLDNIPTWLYTANDKARNPEIRKAYETLGLNNRELIRLAEATPKQDYYLKTHHHTSLFRLDLDPYTLAFCATPGPEELRRLDDLVLCYGDKAIDQYLAEKGVV